MDIFLTLIIKMLPFYGIILLGYISGKYFGVTREALGNLLLYIFLPAIFFYSIVITPLSGSSLFIPLFFLLFCSAMCIIFLFVGRLLWNSPMKNILAQAAGGGNYAYFAIPIAPLILGPQSLGLIVLCGVGYILFENTVGFMVVANGKYSLRESFLKLLKLPSLYAVIAALIINFGHMTIHPQIIDILGNFKGGFSVLGLMMVGLGLSTVPLKHAFDDKYVAASFVAQFFVSPIIIGSIIFLDKTYLHLYSPQVHKAMFLMSILPLAANTIIYATRFKLHPEKVAYAILLSTIFALFFIPLMVNLFLPYL